MTLQCQGELPDSTFVLLKEGTQQPLEKQRPSGYRADFWMPVVRDQDSGVYSCVYYLDSAPLAASNHSNSLEIWVTGKVLKPSKHLDFVVFGLLKVKNVRYKRWLGSGPLLFNSVFLFWLQISPLNPLCQPGPALCSN